MRYQTSYLQNYSAQIGVIMKIEIGDEANNSQGNKCYRVWNQHLCYNQISIVAIHTSID